MNQQFPRGWWTPARVKRLVDTGIAVALAAAVYLYVVFVNLILGPTP
jgi:hypothetical protein